MINSFYKDCVKYSPFILAILGFVYSAIDFLIDKYALGYFKTIASSINFIFFIIECIILGKILNRSYKNLSKDSLTGLYTRDYLCSKFDEQILILKKNKCPASLLMIDVDKFKDINDTYGHMAGDYVLKELGSILKKSIRSNDTIVRWGGEEFIIMLPNADTSKAINAAERIRNIIGKTKFHYGDYCITITLSIGVVTITHEININQFVEFADEMLYKAKERRNSIESLEL